MRKVPHVVFNISGHGFGHVAQTAPVIRLLHERIPELRVTIRTSVPASHLHSRIDCPFTHMKTEGDIGMMMSSALDFLIDESRATFQEFHSDWNQCVEEESILLKSMGADLVFSNVGYLSLAGAQHAGIPNVALCSLNWADIYRHFFGDDKISRQMHSSYANADVFFRVTPGMPMDDLPNLVQVAPIAGIGVDRRDELNRTLKLSGNEKLVLVTMGGISTRLPIECWPRISGVRWLVQKDWQVNHPDSIAIESSGMIFNDLLASSDALICKPGYGSFVEATCSGVPVLYVPRPNWPESSALVTWLDQHNVCREISRADLELGNFSEQLEGLLNSQRTEPVIPGGTAQVADWISGKLGFQETGNTLAK